MLLFVRRGFSFILREKISASDLTVREYAARIGVPFGTVNNALSSGSKNKPPRTVAAIERWLAPFTLSDEERAELITLALLEHAPPEIATQHRQLLDEVEHLRGETSKLRKSVPETRRSK